MIYEFVWVVVCVLSGYVGWHIHKYSVFGNREIYLSKLQKLKEANKK